MNRDAFRAELERLLDMGSTLLGEFEHALEEESRALSERAADALSGVVERKMAMLRKLDSVGNTLGQLLAGAGLGADAASLEQCLDTPELRERWDRFHDGLAKCSHHNRLNGGVIEVSRNYTEQMLNILRGPTASPGVYGPGGKLRGGASACQSIGKA